MEGAGRTSNTPEEQHMQYQSFSVYRKLASVSFHLRENPKSERALKPTTTFLKCGRDDFIRRAASELLKDIRIYTVQVGGDTMS